MRQLYGLLVSMRAPCRRRSKSSSTDGFRRTCVARVPLHERSRFRSIWPGCMHRGRIPGRHRRQTIGVAYLEKITLCGCGKRRGRASLFRMPSNLLFEGSDGCIQFLGGGFMLARLANRSDGPPAMCPAGVRDVTSSVSWRPCPKGCDARSRSRKMGSAANHAVDLSQMVGGQ